MLKVNELSFQKRKGRSVCGLSTNKENATHFDLATFL